MKFPIIALACVVLLLAGILIACGGAQSLAKPFDRFSAKFPGVIAFWSGALMGVFAGIIPAGVAYAATRDQWIAGGVLALSILGCGTAWWRFVERK
jgi:hypothetical protein